jgi:hypothetical protein
MVLLANSHTQRVYTYNPERSISTGLPDLLEI